MITRAANGNGDSACSQYADSLRAVVVRAARAGVAVGVAARRGGGDDEGEEWKDEEKEHDSMRDLWDVLRSWRGLREDGGGQEEECRERGSEKGVGCMTFGAGVFDE